MGGGEVKDGIGKAVTCGSGSTWGEGRGKGGGERADLPGLQVITVSRPQHSPRPTPPPHST